MSSNDVIADEPPPGLTFQEKSLWLSLTATVAVYAAYVARALGLIEAVVLLVIVMIAGNVVLAVHRRPEPRDERDRRFATLAARNAYYVLSAAGFGALGVAALSLGAFWTAHALLLALVLAEITKGASQLVYYRRGV